jgi:hypothetical protein
MGVFTVKIPEKPLYLQRMGEYATAAKHFPRFLPAIAIWFALSGCANGIVGKKTVAAVNQFGTTLSQSVDKASAELDKTRTDVLGTITQTRDTLFDFLRLSSEKEAHDISVGLLQGTVGYLDSPGNRDSLAQLLETLINHTAGPASDQLIRFKNRLLDPLFISQIRQFLQTVMEELVLQPTHNLLNLVLKDDTRIQLNKLLAMVIPAVINDSAIGQIAKLREALLGYNMKKDIAGWVDTALIVANYRLDSTLRPTIKSIVNENSSTIKRYAGDIIAGLVVLAIVIGLVIYYVQHKKVVKHQEMLRKVATEIEEFKKSHPADYDQLTSNIQNAMESGNLEKDMHQFLVKEGIKSPKPGEQT